MELIEVKDSSTKKEFLQLPVRLYQNEKNWIRPLDKDIEKVFDPSQNKYFRHGECIRWILRDQRKTIGRVAAFIDRKSMKMSNLITGGMGFFECIDAQEAAFKLFDQCKLWLQERGIQAMDGPINFGDRDQWWGLLVEGFTAPNYAMNYHLPYYKNLFESYGFKVYFNQYTYHRKVDGKLDPKVQEKADRILSDPRYHFEHARKKNIEKYAEDFRIVYNKAWAGGRGDVKAMSKAQAQAIMKRIKPVMDEKLLWYGYFEGEPITFYLMLPDLNQYFKHMNGKLNWIGKLKFLYLKWTKSCKKMFGVAFGVIPEYQRKGVEAAVVVAFSKVAFAKNFQYKDLEMNWIGDFNPKMMRVAEQVGGEIFKIHITYRKIFDKDIPFERAKILD